MAPNPTKARKITLCWYANTPNGWRYFPCVWEMKHGVAQPKHGWGRYRGEEVHYPTGRYVLRSYLDGKKVYAPLETCHPLEAAQAFNKARRLAASQPAAPKLRLLRDAASAYIADCKQRNAMEAAAQAKLTLDEFVPLANTPYVNAVTRQTVLRYHGAMRKRGLSPRTIANRHDRLKSFLRWCKVDVKFMPETPRYEKRLPSVYTTKETAAILDAADDHMRVVILMGLKLGLRELEIAHAEWGDVHWEDKVFRVTGKPHWDFRVKDAEERDVPIPADVLAVLETWREKHPKTKLIVGTDGDKPNFHLLRTLKRLARRKGLNCGECDGCKSETEECERWTLHEFRRTYCTTMLRNGVDARSVQAWAGHADLQTTMRYLRPTAAKESQDKVNAVVW
jgi:integrase